MSQTLVHVNRHLISANLRDGRKRPIYSVKRRGIITYAHGVIFDGRAELIDPRVRPALSCGARAYIVTHDDVSLIDPIAFSQIEEFA